MRSVVAWTCLAVIGLVITVGVTLTASRLSGQSIGLAAEPLKSTEALAPRVPDAKSGAQRRAVEERSGDRVVPRARRRPRPRPAAPAPAAPAPATSAPAAPAPAAPAPATPAPAAPAAPAPSRAGDGDHSRADAAADVRETAAEGVDD